MKVKITFQNGYKKIDEFLLIENDFKKENLEDMNNNLSID